MKTERRHELKHNSLDAELVKILDYLKEKGKAILLAVLVLVAAISIGWVIVRNRQSAISGPRLQYDHYKSLDISTAKGRAEALIGFEEVALQTDNIRFTALGCVEAADICLLQKVAGDPVSGTLTVAKKHYQRVVDEFSDQPIAAGRAYLGLAKLAEGEGKFDVARENYKRVESMGDDTSVLALLAAKKALAGLSELEKPIRLATKLPPPPATQPDSVITKPAPPTTQQAPVIIQPEPDIKVNP